MSTQGARRVFFAAALPFTIIWMVLIFMFSAQRDTRSSEISGSVCYRIVSGADKVFQLGMEEEQMEEYARLIEHPVRKLAHMSEFAVLACLFLWDVTLLGTWGTRVPGGRAAAYVIAWGLAVLYAGTDELHQLFIPGRAGRLTDVIIDACGALLGLLVVFVPATWYNRKRTMGKR